MLQTPFATKCRSQASEKYQLLNSAIAFLFSLLLERNEHREANVTVHEGRDQSHIIIMTSPYSDIPCAVLTKETLYTNHHCSLACTQAGIRNGCKMKIDRQEGYLVRLSA